jgi:hypothetical protein
VVHWVPGAKKNFDASSAINHFSLNRTGHVITASPPLLTLQTPSGSFALSLVQFGMLLPYGQILLLLSRSASSEWLSVGNPNTSSSGLLMVWVDFSHRIGAVNWVPSNPVVVRPGPGVGVSCPCFLLVFVR